MKRERPAPSDTALPSDQSERLENLKRDLRRRGVEDALRVIPSKVDALSSCATVSALRSELDALVRISCDVRAWLTLSLPAVHEGDFAEDLIRQILATFVGLQSSAARLSDTIVPDLMALGKVKEEAIKAASKGGETSEAYEIAHANALAHHRANMEKWGADLRNCFLLMHDLMEKNISADAAFMAQVRPMGAANHTRRRLSSALDSPQQQQQSGRRSTTRRLMIFK